MTTKKPKTLPIYKELCSGYPGICGDHSQNIYVHDSPTSNCQLFSIGGMNYLLDKYTDEEVIAEFDKISNFICKERCLIDVSLRYQQRIDELFKGKIVFKQPYTSSNGSSMIIYMLDMSEWYYDADNHDWEDPDDYYEDDDE